MKFFVVFAVALACAAADVSHVLKDESTAQVLNSAYDISPEGAYRFAYETANGISAQASAELKNPNSEHASLTVQGGYRYTSPDGTPVEFSYTADEEGYKPVSALLPVAPAVPDYIARSLAYIAAHPPAPEVAAKPTYG